MKRKTTVTETEKKVIKRCFAVINGKEHGGVVVDKQNIIRFIDKSLLGQPRTYGNSWVIAPIQAQVYETVLLIV
jgi:hypothetical protein